jgi:GNAT superfamily N-acetyltransferase
VEFATGGRLTVRITAADVGKRVSVRSLTGPEEHSATFTDTVGVLTSWTDGVLSITRRDGRTVQLAESVLVAGKTVPPVRAGRRGLPAADARELQEVAARGWPAVHTARLGGWTLRASGGFTSRANSVLPHGDPGLPPGEAVEQAAAWYDARGIEPKVQVSTGDPAGDARLDAELAQRGWTAEREAQVRVGALAPLADRAPDPRVVLHRTPDAEWLRAYRRVTEPDASVLTVLRGGPSVWFATVHGAGGRGGRPAAIGRCVVDGRWAGFAAVEVDPAHRRGGLATAVMAELARAALREGASAAYLQVETGNTPARALYDRLGFADHHTYHYRVRR